MRETDVVKRSERGQGAGGTVIIEPHRDDAAMFCHVARRAFCKPHHLITVFSVYKPPLSKKRKAEGRRYCQKFGLVPHDLGFLDFPLRRHDARTERSLLRKIREKLSDVCKRLRCSWVVVPRPYGNGGHPDHHLVWLAAYRAFAGTRDPILVIGDNVPYARRPVTAKFSLFGTRYVPQLVRLTSEEFLEKRNAMQIYESQMKPEYFEAIAASAPGDHTSRPSETLWVPSNVIIRTRQGSARAMFSMRLSDKCRAASVRKPRFSRVVSGAKIEDLGK